MIVSFASATDARPRLVARLIGEGPLPADLPEPLRAVLQSWMRPATNQGTIPR